jgi:hypothetical protein
MGSTVLTVVTGVATGLAASALFWWLQAKLLRPRISICSRLTLATSDQINSKTHLAYQFTVVNHGRFAAADISIKITFSVPGLLSKHGVFDFYMRDLAIPWMGPRTDDQYNIEPHQLLQDAEQQEYCISLERKLGRSLRHLEMRELVKACDGSYVTVFIASNHAFSGARSFKRAIFIAQDFIQENNICERGNCCRTSQMRRPIRSRLVNKITGLAILKG